MDGIEMPRHCYVRYTGRDCLIGLALRGVHEGGRALLKRRSRTDQKEVRGAAEGASSAISNKSHEPGRLQPRSHPEAKLESG